MVDIDPSELAKMGDSVQTKVQADAGDFIQVPCSQVGNSAQGSDALEVSAARIGSVRYPVVLPEHRKPEGAISMYHLAEALQDVLPEEYTYRLRELGKRDRALPSGLEGQDLGKGCFIRRRWGRWGLASPLPSAFPWRTTVARWFAWMATEVFNSTSKSWKPSHVSSCPSRSLC